MYLSSFQYFRGVAILFIVAGHCLFVSDWRIDTQVERIVANLVLGGTALFVFISGFLFHHVYYRRQPFDYRRFLAVKFSYVFVPYLAMSVYPLAGLIGGHDGAGLGPPVTAPYHGWQAALFYLGTGSHSFAYWYIPFVMVMFLLSPLFVRFIEMRGNRQVPAIIALILVAMIIHRPVDNFYLPQSVLYFTPLYLLGIVASLRKERIYAMFRGRAALTGLLGTAVALAMLHAFLHSWVGNFHKEMFRLTTLDLILPQKILLCLFFMVYLARYEGRPLRALDLLARVSFPVFFIHPLVISLFLRFELRPPVPGPFGWILFTTIVLLVSIALALLVKRCVPRYSRYLIGY